MYDAAEQEVPNLTLDLSAGNYACSSAISTKTTPTRPTTRKGCGSPSPSSNAKVVVRGA
jgi:hypothetical protein